MAHWAHFTPVSLSADGTLQRVSCKYCPWGGKHGITANATRCVQHLKKSHGGHPAVSLAITEFVSDSEELDSEMGSQSTSSSAVNPSPPPKKHKTLQPAIAVDRAFQPWQHATVEERLVQLQASHCIPWHTFQSDQFLALMRSLRSDCKVPCTKTLMKKSKQMYDRIQDRIKERLETWGVCAIAIDGWKDHHHCETLGVTLLPLGLQEKPILWKAEQQHCRQSAANMGPFLDNIIASVGACKCKVVAAVTDNASNMVAAVEELVQKHGVIKLNCLSHSGELLVKDMATIWPTVFGHAETRPRISVFSNAGPGPDT
jgi:hypothetical protein